jgi:LPS-assembly protein
MTCCNMKLRFSHLALVFGIWLLLFSAFRCYAQEVQVEHPDNKYLFLEDKYKHQTDKSKKTQSKQRRKAAEGKPALGQTLPFDINAASLNFDSTGQVVSAEGDVIITYSSLVAESQRAKVNIQSNEAELDGDVRISDISGNLLADFAKLNLNTGEADLKNLDTTFTEGDAYRLFARNAHRDEGDAYVLEKAELSTCHCPDDAQCFPWSLHASDARITQNGYGQAWNATLNVYDVPVFYFPYILFPAKTERQSGLLPGSFGMGRKSGFGFELPLYLAIDRSTDMTVSAVYESQVHLGTEIELRKVFSRKNELDSGFVYLNESARHGDLLGTNTSGIYDPNFGINRYAGYLNHSWSGPNQLQYLMDGRYVSDDLFVREYEYQNIAPSNSRYVTSQAVLRSPLADSFAVDLSAEYDQSLVTDQDLVFQRVPELTITGMNSYRPFGENPLGLRLVPTHGLSSGYFSRPLSYEGSRSEAYERVKLPFYFHNYFDGSLEGSARATAYNLSETAVDPTDPSYSLFATNAEEVSGTDAHLNDSSTRLFPGVGFSLNTVLEKVFPVSEGNLIKELADLGTAGRNEELVRVKHTIEPGLKYRVTPYVDQSENPLFDSIDHLAQRNVATYNITQRLYGRYDPRNEYIYGIEETTPELSDIGSMRANNPLDETFTFGFQDDIDKSTEDYKPLRRGSIRELADLKLYQSFDVLEQQRDTDPNRSAFSDLGGAVLLYPNEHVVLRSDVDFDIENSIFRAYSVEGTFYSKRGDNVRSLLRFVENNVRQLESSVELKLTDRMKLGYYSRFDDLAGEFIEQRAGARFLSGCKCWIFDLMVVDKINPKETKFLFNITLVGLGGFGDTFFRSKDTTTQSISQ